MAVRLSGRYLGDKKVSVVHDDSGAEIRTAAPKDNQGDGTSFSPTDLVGAALGTCMVTLMALAAERNSINLGQPQFSVLKKMSKEPPRRIAELALEFHLPAHLDPAARAIIEHAALTCPVSQSLAKETAIVTNFVYDL